MATFSSIFVPGVADAIKVSVLANSSASTNGTPGNAGYIGFNRIVAIQPGANMTIAFFNSTSGTPATASSTSWPALANSILEWDTGSSYDSISFFNTTGSTATVWIWPLSRI